MPGQVGQFGIFGIGESTFAISSKPSEKDFIQFSVMKAGEVTKVHIPPQTDQRFHVMPIK